MRNYPSVRLSLASLPHPLAQVAAPLHKGPLTVTPVPLGPWARRELLCQKTGLRTDRLASLPTPYTVSHPATPIPQGL